MTTVVYDFINPEEYESFTPVVKKNTRTLWIFAGIAGMMLLGYLIWENNKYKNDD